MSRVWILGAGFSRSLGAPLLNDLFSLRKRTLFMNEYGEAFGLADRGIHQAYALFHHGMDYPEGYLFQPNYPTPRGTKLWSDAENFIETLDSCLSSKSARNELTGIWEDFQAATKDAIPGGKLRDISAQSRQTAAGALMDAATLARAAKRIIATECHQFLLAVTNQTERAKPYTAWGESLDKDDTVITFNYDLVIEQIARRGIVVAGTTSGDIDSDTSDAKNTNTPILIKLHGSVDWAEQSSAPTGLFPFSRQTPALGSSKYSPAIATPGASKLAIRQGAFSRLWLLAGDRIRQAKEIYIVGYGLPESDASAREFLLVNVVNNEVISKASDLKITIVLGDVDFRVRRLERLLAMAPAPAKYAPTLDPLGSFAGFMANTSRTSVPHEPRVLPMYAQDFLAQYAINTGNP